jgi:hypothetical protein
MKISVWDILSVLVLISAIVVASVILSIFANPTSSINPFPPPTMIPTIDIPTPTPTLVRLPPTWTPAPKVTETPHPTGTPYPSPTVINISG